MAWLTNNGVYLIITLAVAVFLYRNAGVSGMLKFLSSILGLGFLIFIHELGHFLAAKWCDVHVHTFSIGFGPAFPGLSYQKGETLYQVGLIPLGGFVGMVGEGAEADENEDYPRSFKNKTVFQRMMIISAGVLMNVLFGAIFFCIVYIAHGVERPPAIVYKVDNASPAWQAGVKSGSQITRIGNKQNPFFDNLRTQVALSSKGQEIDFVFAPLHGDKTPGAPVKIEPRKEATDNFPVIGIAPPDRLVFPPQRYFSGTDRPAPVVENSPAGAARIIPLQEGDLVIGATDPAKEFQLTPIAHDRAKKSFDSQELCQRMMGLENQIFTVEILRDGQDKPVRMEIPLGGFTWEDKIVRTTASSQPEQLYRLESLPLDPSGSGEEQFGDFFEFRRRLRLLAGKPMVIEVERKEKSTSPSEKETSPRITKHRLLVPPAFHSTLGVNMRMGEIAAVRRNSPAARAEIRGRSTVQEPDKIIRVAVKYEGGSRVEMDLSEPMKLPFLLEQAAQNRPQPGKPVQVEITLARFDPTTGRNHGIHTPVTLEWDEGWNDQEDIPINDQSPLSIPQLGLAFWVESMIDRVIPEGPGAEAGLKENDQLTQIAFPEKKDKNLVWSSYARIDVKKGWPKTYSILQGGNISSVKVDVKRGESQLKGLEIKKRLDRSWPLVDRGFYFQPDFRLQKASTITQALLFGAEDTIEFIQLMYLQLRSILTGRISAKNLGGPGELLAQAYTVAEDPFIFLRWLGMISLNLAVVNFLPIPVLDGGHMVFLLWEAIRGKRPSEAVQMAATYAGLALLLSLMGFVIYLDIMRRGSSLMTWFPRFPGF